MKRRSTFLGRQYAGLFTAATLMAGADFCIGLVVSVVSGNCLGSSAFAAMAAVYPYRLLPDIFVLLLADGTASLYAQAIGRCDRDEASRVFSQGLTVATLVGTVLTVAFVLGEDAYLDIMGVIGTVRTEALGFGRGYVYTFLPTMVVMFLFNLVYVDGGAKRCLFGSIGYMVLHIATAWFFCKAWGATGLAWSINIATLAFVTVVIWHLRSRENTLRYRLTLRFDRLGHILALGFGTSVQQIAAVLQTFVLARIASVHYGARGLACLSVVSCVESFLCFTKAAAQSALPLVSVYYGEGNRSGMVATLRRAVVCVAVEGLVFTGLLVAFPHAVAVLFGLGDIEYVDLLALSSRIVGLFILPASLTFLWGLYFRMVGNTRVLALYAPMQWVAFPLAFALGGAELFGPIGFACGFAGQLAWLMIAAALGFALARRDNLVFPLLLPREPAGRLTRVSVWADREGAAQAAQRVRELLRPMLSSGDRRLVGMALVAEEVVLVISEANAARRVRVEITVDVANSDSPRLIVRDDGRIFDITDPDQNLRSMSSYVLTRVVSVKTERINLTTAGHNRSILTFVG